MADSGSTVHEYRGVGYLYENWGADRVWVALEDVQSRVDEKRGELRELISERYHDLIDSADAIVGMDRTVDEFKTIVANVESASRALVQGEMLKDTQNPIFLLKESDSVQHDTAPVLTPIVSKVEDQDELDAQLRAADIVSLAAVNIWESIDSQRLWKACDSFVQAEQAFKSLPPPMADLTPAQPTAFDEKEERDFAALGLDPSQFKDLRAAAAMPAKSQQTMASSTQAEGSKTSVWELYPFLKSHWSLVQEARQRILLEARALLESEDLNLDTTCGAIRAVIVLGDATAAQSVDRLLDARYRVLLRTLQDIVPGTLERSIAIVQQTIVDMADLYVSGSRLVGDVDPHHVRESVTSWVEARADEIALASQKILEQIPTLDALAQTQKRIIEIEISGGASTDAASELDVDIWRAAVQACVLPRLSEQNTNNLFLYPMMFGSAFVSRAADLLQSDFEAVCLSFEKGIQSTLSASIEREHMPDVQEASGNAMTKRSTEQEPQDDDDADEDDRLFTRLGERIMSESAVDRAGAAVVLLHIFASEVSRLLESRESLVIDTALVDSQMHDLAKLTLGKLTDNLREKLAASVDAFGSSVSALSDKSPHQDPTQNDDVFVALKRTLFLARVAEGLLIGGVLKRLLSEEAQATLKEDLNKLSASVYQVWADASLSMSSDVLSNSLQSQDWDNSRDWAILHSGWERIPVSFKADEDDFNQDDDEEGAASVFDEEDTIELPGSVSPGVALFSFLLSKQVRLVGDSRFISSGSVLSQNIEDLLPLLEQGAPSREYLNEAANQFCKSSEQAVLLLAHGGLKLVQEVYSKHLDQNSSHENEPAALQTIFDLHWFEWLLLVDQKQEATNEIPQLIESLVEVHVDTVNWTLQEPHLLTRIKIYRDRNALLFGPSLMVKARAAKTWTASSEYAFESAGESQESYSVYDTNNMLHLGYLPTNTLPRIPLLPIPSNVRSMRSNAAAQRRGTTSRALSSPSAKSRSSASSAHGEKATTEAATALKSIGQVGSNLFSQASSWLNR